MKMKKHILLLFAMFLLPFAVQAETFNVKKYGAKGNGKKLDSPAIQKAIDACHEAGGGTVLVPAGTYLSATIVLKDNVNLHLEKDALFLGTQRPRPLHRRPGHRCRLGTARCRGRQERLPDR